MPEPRPVRVGVVGCGVVATAYYLPYLRKMPNAELVAVCDSDPVRTRACKRLFGAREAYSDYYDMLRHAEIDLVMILTGPGTHAAFSLAAAEAGKHLLIQKPMALTLDDATRIVDAVRKHRVKALIEPSSDSPLDPDIRLLRSLIDNGAIGRPIYFSCQPGSRGDYHPLLGGNPYGLAAFFAEDSGGMLFDFPYVPSRICALLGDCRSVLGAAKVSVPDRWIVPDEEYTKFISACQDPDHANYWTVVCDLPRSQQVRMAAPDNVFSTYEMESDAIGIFHAGRPFHPNPPGTGNGGLEIYGTDGNMIFGGGHPCSVISKHRHLLPETDDKGWWRLPDRRDRSKPAIVAAPAPGTFNYYYESTAHIIDCIREDRDPAVNVEWGRHIVEMMYGALVSAKTGERYQMRTTLRGLR